MSAHDEMLDDVAVYALGALTPEQSRAVRDHLSTCAECRAEYRELAPAVDALAYSAEACPDAATATGSVAPPSPILKKRIMRRIRPNVAEMRAVRPIVWPAYAVAAIALALALSTGILDTMLGSQLRQTHANLLQLSEHDATITRELAYQRAAMDALISPQSEHYAVTGGEVIKHAGRIFLAMDALPAPPKGKVYQAWTLSRGRTRMTPSVTFLPTRGGVAVIPIPVNASNVAAVAVSVEPEGGSKQPTTAPTFVLKFS